jgi:hypothetical protein
MPNDIPWLPIVGFTSALAGAIASYCTAFLLQPKVRAEGEKLLAEAERIRTETRLAERSNLQRLDLQDATRGPEREIPAGWWSAGSHPEDYDMAVDTRTRYRGHPTAFIKSRTASEGFGTLMQRFKAAQYEGTRLRMTAVVKAKNVASWSGLWMRVDGLGNELLAFDNMQDRTIGGSRDWEAYSIVLDVPKGSRAIAFGILLHGEGQVWVTEFEFRVVDESSPTTEFAALADTPQNLRFEE